MKDLLKKLKEEILPAFEKAVPDNSGYFSRRAVKEEITGHLNSLKSLLEEQKSMRTESARQVEGFKHQLSALRMKLDEKEREINELMITDNLTKLYSRHHLATVLEDEIARCRRYGHPLAVIMIDIDGLRGVNCSYGKMAGDRLLTFTGNLIKSNIRTFDRAFRYGGEEFVVVLPETDRTMAYIVAERIRKNFERSCPRERAAGQEGIYTVSIGITSVFTYATNTIEGEELIGQADRALLEAKEQGGNLSISFSTL
jgi:diguanylate cyclase (GGDEF)-like protein